MVHFSKLKLYGFKSFVDKTELEIGTGLNGIVGPNGCGKSNLVEALRWVMGEKSAKNMRGGGMEDVIFAGTSKRPARNLAEVTVVMSNEDGTAPAPFNSATEIEINRKIERDKGSQYRVNGKAVRARDVNLLFADTATGANSPALVSQGRITEIITSKPSDRRKILEESAGISGLHSRRHEAELRLRAAETNLTRLDDVLGEMRTRLSSLKRQARQAERYKELNDKIRRLDMALSWSQWQTIHVKIKTERDQFAMHNNIVQSALESTKSLSKQIESAETSLPDCRKNHLEAQAVLQNFRVSLERLEQDIQSKTKGLQDAEQTKDQINTDSEFTQNQFNQIESNITSIKAQYDECLNSGKTLPDDIANTEKKVNETKKSYDDLVTKRQSLETSMAIARDNRQSIENQKLSTEDTISKIQNNIEILNNAISETTQKIGLIKSDSVFDIDLDKLGLDVEKLQSDIKSTEVKYQKSIVEQDDLKSEHDDVKSDLSTFNGELSALVAMTQSKDETDLPQGDNALINNLKVTEGYEKSVSSALGQWASIAGVDDNASVYWSPHSTIIETPKGTKPLSDYVEAPTALSPLLKAIGVVDTLTESKLEAGQMIVTLDGSFMRWDGLIVKSNATHNNDQTHVILEQKNRIIALEKITADKQLQLDNLLSSLEKSNNKNDNLLNTLNDLKTDLSFAEKSLNDTTYHQSRLKDSLEVLVEKQTEQQSRLMQNQDELKTTQSTLESLLNQLEAGDDSQLLETQNTINALNTQISETEIMLDDARTSLVQLRQEKLGRENTVVRLKSDLSRYKTEQEQLTKRLDDLSSRADVIDAKILAYKASNDDDTDTLREELLNKVNHQTEALTELATQLDIQESTYRDLQSKLREEESKAANAREDRARVQANVSNAEEELSRIDNLIHERFDLTPQTLEEQIYSLFDNDIPSIDILRDEKETVTRQRDNIGPVNLRAAMESQETETQLLDMETERTDLTKAIEQLRGGIAKLNREAKERLAIAFTRVDNHFQRLFGQLFEGGKAYLEMIQSEDPLEAGLEIYAEPPGKSLQKLSLLSGGEQTLTATALIFAMFLTNPSPICVLDEIDAPLDDANVDRVCTLMENIARETDTRFIVITHHRMTMARMDRLYGVTMGERGVSQLVSVDMALQGEMELSESA